MFTDVDECTDAPDTCDVNAVCSNTDGSYTCLCNAGYSGNGTTCTGKYTYFKVLSLIMKMSAPIILILLTSMQHRGQLYLSVQGTRVQLAFFEVWWEQKKRAYFKLGKVLS